MAAGTSALLVLIGGGAAAVAVMTREEPRGASAAGRGSTADAPVGGLGGPRAVGGPEGLGGPTITPTAAGSFPLGARLGDAGHVAGAGDRDSTEANRTATRAQQQPASGTNPALPGAAGTPAAPPAAADTPPVVTTQTVSETRPIPYRTQLVRDPAMPRGQKRIQTEGINGEETLHWLVTFADGRQTGRRLVDTIVTREPQQRVIAFGWQGRGQNRGPGGGPGPGPGRGPGRGPGHGGHHRECGPSLGACLPLGRSGCPNKPPPGQDSQARPAEKGQTLPGQDSQARPGQKGQTLPGQDGQAPGQDGAGIVPLLDEDLALLDPGELDDLNLNPALTCPTP
jgi:G5 domain